MKYVPYIFLCFLLAACATYNAKLESSEWAHYERWDQNDDLILDGGEFTSSYIASNFFSRWSDNSNSIAVPALCDSAFKILDTSRDGVLDSTEISSRKAYYLVGDSIPDINQMASTGITKADFDNRICRGQMAMQFDKGQDDAVSEKEMADAMFAICDTDNDGGVNSLEFYLWQVYRK